MRPRKEDTRDPLIGKWLCRSEWWLFPVFLAGVSAALSSAQQTERKSNPRATTELLTEIGRLGEEVRKEKIAIYNAQPRWSLSDIRIESSSDAPKVVEEFLWLVKFAAAEFCWTLNRPTKEMHWKKHAWKHTTFAEIERIIADVKAGHWLPPELRIDQIGSFEEAQILFGRAKRREPDAVARIDSVFPSQADKNRAAKHVFELKDEEAVPPIPSARQLAAELAEIAVRSPDSQDAKRARRQSALLLSMQAVKGSRPQGGRPPSQLHEEVVSTVWMMGYAVSKQMREVRDFLQKSEPDSGHLEGSSIKKQHAKALGASKVRPFVLYSLRHTFLTRLGESGCDAWTLARIAGHSSVAMSTRYVHPSEDAVLSAVERLGGHRIGHSQESTNLQSTAPKALPA
jgi:hypothetical protein